jgi:hypothetical protein
MIRLGSKTVFDLSFTTNGLPSHLAWQESCSQNRGSDLRYGRPMQVIRNRAADRWRKNFCPIVWDAAFIAWRSDVPTLSIDSNPGTAARVQGETEMTSLLQTFATR